MRSPVNPIHYFDEPHPLFDLGFVQSSLVRTGEFPKE
jgi:hypothetical protein